MAQLNPTHNQAHAIWTVLPNGYADPDRRVFKLALVVSLRAITVNGLLGDMLELTDWPAQLATLDTVSLFVEGQQGTVQATVTSDRPSSALWRALFAPTTFVQLTGGGEVGDAEQVASSVAYQPLVRTLRGIYEGTTAARDATARSQSNPLSKALSGLAQWSLVQSDASDSAAPGGMAFARAVVPAAAATVQTQVANLLDPTTMTAASIAAAADLLRAHGLDDAASVVPLVSVIRRLRGAGTGTNGAAVPISPHEPGPGRLDHVRPVEQADFHQVLGLVSAQPALALALGLRFELQMPAFEGERSIRVTGGLPLLLPGGAPWSRVVADRASGRFTMATQPNAPTEIVQGMLDLRPNGPGSEKYVLTTLDVVGITAQLAGMAANAPASPQLPARRNVGITLAQVDRRASVVQHTVARGKAIAESFGQPQGIEPLTRPQVPQNAVATVGPGETVLFADDVTAGYRVDVRDGDGEWRSLMRRVARYTIGRDRHSPVLSADDEGFIDAITVVEQRDAAGASQLEVSETVCTWDGWSSVVRRPGPSVSSDGNGGVHTELVPRQVSDAYPLRIEVAVKDGTLPRLRFGHRYQFRVHAVDLAGNSIDPALCDPGLVSPAVTYRRLDPLPAPVLVLRRALSAGESITRLVVRSDGKGNPLGGCERHVAAPKAWQNLAELHGHFDAAMGVDSPERAAARQRLLTLGALEAGACTDVMVPDPADPTRQIPAPGISIAVNEDAPGPPTGSLDALVRGMPLPAGEYVVHNTDAMIIPYLVDPLATGVALAGLPTPSGEVVTVKFGGGAWPNVQPLRLIARPGSGGVGVETGSAAGRPTLTVTIPPAAEIVTSLSSTLTPAGLALMEIDLPEHAKQGALAGQEALLTPAQEVRFVHAVRCPLLPLAMQTATADAKRAVGATVVTVTGTAVCHPASTARLDIEATWQELIDDGVSEVRSEPRTAVVGSVTVAPDTPTVSWKVRHALGDNKRRDITYRPVATTRFREYFAPDTPPEELVRRVKTGIMTVAVNTARPDLPEIHSVLPTFRWQRTLAQGVLTSVRRTAGLRVWLHRPWGLTGTDERLGVLVYRDQAGGEAAKEAFKKGAHPLHTEISRWCGDPLDGWAHTAPHLTAANFPARTELDQSLPAVQLPGGPAVHRDVLGHAVHYDRDRALWFADVDIEINDDQKYFPFVRLALVRHQPQSVPGCQVSDVVVTDPIQLPPMRTLTASVQGPDRIQVTVTGPWINNSLFEVNLQSRVPDPLLGFNGGPSAISARASSVHGHHHVLTSSTAGNTITATGVVPTRINGVPPDVPAARLVVRELQRGYSLHFPGEPPSVDPTGPANRPVYVEIVDEAQLRPKNP
jgi:hypothetical protein